MDIMLRSAVLGLSVTALALSSKPAQAEEACPSCEEMCQDVVYDCLVTNPETEYCVGRFDGCMDNCP